mmetsp:Transcript_8103/g.19594  ORF Transcript_8103/g.19594 Transcript_8103/m.19594 type:complete len:273 (+) Transcript_8103:1444-2262(+)
MAVLGLFHCLRRPLPTSPPPTRQKNSTSCLLMWTLSTTTTPTRPCSAVFLRLAPRARGARPPVRHPAAAPTAAARGTASGHQHLWPRSSALARVSRSAQTTSTAPGTRRELSYAWRTSPTAVSRASGTRRRSDSRPGGRAAAPAGGGAARTVGVSVRRRGRGPAAPSRSPRAAAGEPPRSGRRRTRQEAPRTAGAGALDLVLDSGPQPRPCAARRSAPRRRTARSLSDWSQRRSCTESSSATRIWRSRTEQPAAAYAMKMPNCYFVRTRRRK